MGEEMRATVKVLSSYWPLASRKQAIRQAIRLVRAKRYLERRGIEASSVGSTFEYSSSPTVLKHA
jgi:hypothetical protein